LPAHYTWLSVHKPTFWDQVEHELRALDEHDGREPLSDEGLAIPAHLCWRDTAHTCDGGTNTSKMKRRYFRCQHAKCRTCVDLNYELYANTDENDQPISLYDKSGYRRISTSIYALNASSEVGCQLCMIIFDGIKKFIKLRPVREDFASSWNSGMLDVVLQRGGGVEVRHLRTEIKF
jgi:hypothetical protein